MYPGLVKINSRKLEGNFRVIVQCNEKLQGIEKPTIIYGLSGQEHSRALSFPRKFANAFFPAKTFLLKCINFQKGNTLFG